MDKKWIIENVFPKLRKTARKLEILKLEELLFDDNMSSEIFSYLDNLQNEDGGFPGYLEPDVRSANSTIIATQIALDNYLHCGGIKNSEVKEKIENYLNSNFNQDEMRWNIVSGDITDAPRAFWWNPELEKTFGYSNPSAAIAALVIKLNLNVKYKYVSTVMDKIIATELSSDNIHDHQIMSKMFDYLEMEYPDNFVDAGEKLIEFDSSKWVEYVPGPIDVITSMDHPLYKKYKKEVNKHLEYLTNILEKELVISPTWTWGQFEEHFVEAKKDWQGIMTLELVKKLIRFKKL